MLDITLCGKFALFPKSWKKKRKEKKTTTPTPAQDASGSGPSLTLLFLPADHVHTDTLIEAHNITRADVYVFNNDGVYVSCSGPSRWMGDGKSAAADDFIGSNPATDERLHPAFAKSVVALIVQTLGGRSLKVFTIWQGETFLLTTYPIMKRAEEAVRRTPHRRHTVIGGILITQPCEGIPISMASTAFGTKLSDSVTPPSSVSSDDSQ